MVQISLAFGFAVFVGVHICGPVSGGYLNPALTFGSLVSGRIGLVRAILFVICQVLGAIGKFRKIICEITQFIYVNVCDYDNLTIYFFVSVGSAVLYGITPEGHRGNLGLNALFTVENNESLSVTPAGGFWIEVIGTMILMWVVLSITDKRAEPFW